MIRSATWLSTVRLVHALGRLSCAVHRNAAADRESGWELLAVRVKACRLRLSLFSCDRPTRRCRCETVLYAHHNTLRGHPQARLSIAYPFSGRLRQSRYQARFGDAALLGVGRATTEFWYDPPATSCFLTRTARHGFTSRVSVCTKGRLPCPLKAVCAPCMSLISKASVALLYLCGVKSKAIGHVSKHGPRSIACVQV